MTPNKSHLAGLELAKEAIANWPVTGLTSAKNALDQLIEEAKSAPEPVQNQCDGCNAGVPLVDGVHSMGKPGGYSDPMSCQAAKYAPEPVQGEAVEVVEVVAIFQTDKNEYGEVDYYDTLLPVSPGTELMTVAQHKRIMAAACKPDVQVPVTGSLDEIDSPVWPFINEEARKVGAEKGRIETYSYGLANGGVVVLWDGPRVHAMAVTIRDDLNRTRCVRMLAAAKPDAELVALLDEISQIFPTDMSDDKSGRAGWLPHVRDAVSKLRAKLASLK